MSLALEHIDACVPITGLKVLSVKNARLILQAQGNYSCLIGEESGRLLAKLRTFKGYNIHGFLVLNRTSHKGAQNVQVIAWGEYSLRLIDLYYANDKPNGHLETSLTASSAEYRAPDWMLAGCTDGSGNAFLVTGHNALLSLCVVNGINSKYKRAIFLRQLVTGFKSVLYSADVILLSASHVLIAVGTVFGEIIVWSCFRNNFENENPSSALSLIHHFFTGHEGSIFGVKISPGIPFLHGDQPGRLLASCSDDRTVRVWDISDCEHKSRDDPPAYSTDGFELRNTGFGATGVENHELGSESCVAKAFGHVSRIWGVRFLPLVEDDKRKLSLLSHGEDATCLLWSLAWGVSPRGNDFQLRQVSSFHKHTGRNIFSLDMYRASPETIVHTGGADGAIKTLRIAESEMTDESADGNSASNSNVRRPKGRGSVRAYAFVSPDCIIATSAQGIIQLGWITSQAQDSEPKFIMEPLCSADDLQSFSVATSLPYKGLALLGNAQGLVRLYNHKTKSLSTLALTDKRMPGLFACDSGTETYSPSHSSYTLSFVASCAVVGWANLFMVMLRDAAETDVVNIALDLPRRFEVNCASLVCGNNCLVLGSRNGALAVYRISNTGRSLQPLIFIHRVHGEAGMAGVNKIIPFWSHSARCGTLTEYFMTCGRDGYYCVHEMKLADDPEKPISLRTVHRSTTNLGQNVVGAYFDRRSQDLMLYGFQHKQFILWNESAQAEIANIECGGARGFWAFHPGDENNGGGVFLWTQAATLNAYRSPNDNRPLRAGAHGREIKSMQVFNAAERKNTVFATGAEDTTVRIFGPRQPQVESEWGAFKCLRVLKHNTSLQQVSFSKDGRFLFTSSGLEEFYVWRIQSIPVFGFAAHLLALSPKDDPNSDLRVTSFDILDVEGQGIQQGFLFCLTLSNSTIKIFHFSSSGDDGRFTLLARGKYTSNCLTQSRFLLRGSSLGLITTSTDGHFTLWNLTPVLGPFHSMSTSALSMKQPLDGASVRPENITCESRYHIHSNSIKSVELAQVSDTVTLVTAGGDDNALSLSLLDASFRDAEMNAYVTTITIPDAHAASVTAVKVLEQQPGNGTTTSICVASSGNDHRVKIWSVDVDVQKEGPGRIAVRNVVDEYSNVADISSLDVIHGDSGGDNASLGGHSKLLICGVGMEMLDICHVGSGNS